uniref:Uncharacterized protein n=1 Tax=viral metagenome TaxID=1070528 RepID=A0A6C0EVL5_9ZZZZ
MLNTNIGYTEKVYNAIRFLFKYTKNVFKNRAFNNNTRKKFNNYIEPGLRLVDYGFRQIPRGLNRGAYTLGKIPYNIGRNMNPDSIESKFEYNTGFNNPKPEFGVEVSKENEPVIKPSNELYNIETYGILTDNTYDLWSLLKLDQTNAFKQLGIVKPSKFKGNEFRDYIFNYINKPCKFIVNFDITDYYSKFLWNFIYINFRQDVDYDLNTTIKVLQVDKIKQNRKNNNKPKYKLKQRSTKERQHITNYLFSEYNGKTKFHICKNKTNIIFYKPDILDILINLANQTGLFVNIDINDVLENYSCTWTNGQDDYIKSFIKILHGTTKSCDLKSETGKKYDNFNAYNNIIITDYDYMLQLLYNEFLSAIN